MTSVVLIAKGPRLHCEIPSLSNLVRSWRTPDVETSLAQIPISSTSPSHQRRPSAVRAGFRKGAARLATPMSDSRDSGPFSLRCGVLRRSSVGQGSNLGVRPPFTKASSHGRCYRVSSDGGSSAVKLSVEKAAKPSTLGVGNASAKRAVARRRASIKPAQGLRFGATFRANSSDDDRNSASRKIQRSSYGLNADPGGHKATIRAGQRRSRGCEIGWGRKRVVSLPVPSKQAKGPDICPLMIGG